MLTLQSEVKQNEQVPVLSPKPLVAEPPAPALPAAL